MREGWTPAEDALPRRFLSEGLPSSGEAQAVLPRERLEEMIQAYYSSPGWETDGRVPRSVLESLRLDDVAPSKPEPDWPDARPLQERV